MKTKSQKEAKEMFDKLQSVAKIRFFPKIPPEILIKIDEVSDYFGDIASGRSRRKI